MPRRLNILLDCGKNQRRSPTAERIYQNDERMTVRSAGLSPKSHRRVSARELDWADAVLVMERVHATQIRQEFRERSDLPAIESLDIPDDYPLMDPELIRLIR